MRSTAPTGPVIPISAVTKLVPTVGDTMVTNPRRPMLSLVEDTTPGVHDMLMAACDVYRYELLGAIGYHLLPVAALPGLTTGYGAAPVLDNVSLDRRWRVEAGSVQSSGPVSRPGPLGGMAC